jgi:hypothetical protein
MGLSLLGELASPWLTVDKPWTFPADPGQGADLA